MNTCTRKLLAGACALGLLTAGTGIAAADDITNDLDASVDVAAETMSLTAGGSPRSTTLTVVPRNGDSKNGCNLTGSTTLTVSVTSSDLSVATVSPSSVTFTSCDDTEQLTVTPVAQGSSTVSLTQTSNNTGGSFNLAPATFAVDVAPAALVVPADTTPPVVTPTVEGTEGDNGWYTSDVLLTWAVSDDESLVTSAPCAPVTIDQDQKDTTYTCTAVSAGGTTMETVTIKRDATAPTVELVGGPEEGGRYFPNDVPAGICSGTDLMSETSCTLDAPALALGTNTYTATATDEAGNSASVTRTFWVRTLTLDGFSNPVDMGGTVLNTVKGGATVPLKFTVFDEGVRQTATSVVKSFTTRGIACPGGLAADDVDFVTTGGTALRYDSTAGQFIQNWQTPKQPGKCFEAIATFIDGGAIKASFKLK